MTRLFERIKPMLAWLDIRDVLVFGGIGLTAYGLSLAYPPAGWVFAGLALAWLGIRA